MKISKKEALNIWIGIFVTVLMVCIMLYDFKRSEKGLRDSPFALLESKLFDYRMRLRGMQKPPDNVVIAAIDEKSLRTIGRWPWDRDIIAKLVDRMTDAGAEVIMFDVWFSEPDKNDPELARSIKNAGNVILPVVFEMNKRLDGKQNEVLLNSAFRSIQNDRLFSKYAPLEYGSALLSVDEINSEAAALGHINMNSDDDGTLRWEMTAIKFKDRIYPSIDIQVASFFSGIPPEKIELKACEGVQLGNKFFIPTDEWGRLLINYYGDAGTFQRISLSDIYEHKLNPGQLAGKIVLVGATAKGAFDLRVTPFSAEMPGIEKHASVIASILEDKLLREVKTSTNLVVLLISGLIFSLMMSLLLRRFKIAGAAAVALLSLYVLGIFVYHMFVRYGLWINAAYPALNILFIFIVVTAYNFAVEEKFARKIRAMFSNYITERVVAELIRNPEMAKLGGERREITVLFSDVRGFTSFSEKHAPEEVVAILNEYLAEMTEIVLKWEGTLDKFIGDAILAFWGAPMQQDNHAELAVRCALNMIDRLKELQKKWQLENRVPFDIGIGINTGEVIVGNIGAEGKKMDYTVIGDEVNLGSRVESLTRKYGVHIIITEFTLNKISGGVSGGGLGHLSINGLGSVVVKGKEKPVALYELGALDHGCSSAITECKETDVVHMKEK